MKENLFRVAFWTLLLLTIMVFGCGTIYGQAIKVEVSPKVAIVNPYRHITFHFRWIIERDEGNRLYALSYSCGKEWHHSQTEIDKNSPRVYDRYPEMIVLEDCTFQACVVRVIQGKPKTLCDIAEVRTNEVQP